MINLFRGPYNQSGADILGVILEEPIQSTYLEVPIKFAKPINVGREE